MLTNEGETTVNKVDKPVDKGVDSTSTEQSPETQQQQDNKKGEKNEQNQKESTDDNRGTSTDQPPT